MNVRVGRIKSGLTRHRRDWTLNEFHVNMPTYDNLQLKDIQTGQRLVIYAILLNLVVVLLIQALSKQQGMEIFLLAIPVMLASTGVSLFGIYKLTAGLGYEPGMRILFCGLMMIPCVCTIILVSVNVKATKVLRDHGFKMGLLGAKKPKHP